MNESFTVTSTPVKDGALVAFGPIDPQTGWRLQIPGTLTRKVVYPALRLEIFLDCVFSGDRLEISKLTIEGLDAYIATRDLTQLALPAVMAEIVAKSVPDAERWSSQLELGNPNRLNGPGYLAQLYWFHHAGWGAPRAAIMSYMSWSRANANFHIKKIGKLFPLPGSHAGSSGSSTQGA